MYIHPSIFNGMLDSQLHESHILRYNVTYERIEESSEELAVISFLDESYKRINTIKLKVVPLAQLYHWIDEGLDFNLQQVYISNFSLKEYRKLKGIPEHEFITLKNFKANHVFFDCELETDFSYVKFEGASVNFSQTLFGNGFVSFNNADFGHTNVTFKKARFGSGTKNFQSVTFGDGDISFEETNFGNGNLIFADTKFSNGHVNFRNTIYGEGNVDFKFARFSQGNIIFEKASFGKGKKDFKNVEFGGGRLDFRRVSFNDGDISFEGVEFGNGKLNFRGSTFGAGQKSFDLADFANSDVNFDRVDFGTGGISFNQAKANSISFNGCAFNCHVDFRFGKCSNLNLNNSIVRDLIDAIPESETVVIKEMHLNNMRILGRLFINWRENNVFDLVYNQKDTSYFQKAEQFRILKENFRVNGQYEDEDLAYIEFKRCEALSDLSDELKGNALSKLIAYPKFYFQKYVFDFVGRYATSPSRVLANGALVIFAFGFLYYFMTNFFPTIGAIHSTLPSEINHLTEFGNNIYYSAITFLTIGYGDYFPYGILKTVASIEGFCGVFLMSYFTVAFVRKILR